MFIHRYLHFLFIQTILTYTGDIDGGIPKKGDLLPFRRQLMYTRNIEAVVEACIQKDRTRPPKQAKQLPYV